MDADSPFAHLPRTAPAKPTRTVHINYCTACHHVWKAPAVAAKCINCIQPDPRTVRSLVSYDTSVPIT